MGIKIDVKWLQIASKLAKGFLEASGGLLEALGGLLERSWMLLERSWDALGGHFRKPPRENGSNGEPRAPIEGTAWSNWL